MTVGDLLDELARNVLRDRSNLISGPDDNLWSDETLVRYMNEAQYRFARRSLALRVDSDDEPDVCEFALVADQQVYVLHPKVAAVISAKYDTDSQDLTCISHQTLSGTWAQGSDGGWIDTAWSQNAATQAPGRPQGYWVDESVQVSDQQTKVKMKLDRIPTASEAGLKIRMRIARMPLNDLTVDNLDASPEIPSQYQIDMLEWAAYLALRGHDVDTELRSKGEDHKKRFEEVLKEVRNEQIRKMFAPVGWGFGRGGFSWAR